MQEMKSPAQFEPPSATSRNIQRQQNPGVGTRLLCKYVLSSGILSQMDGGSTEPDSLLNSVRDNQKKQSFSKSPARLDCDTNITNIRIRFSKVSFVPCRFHMS